MKGSSVLVIGLLLLCAGAPGCTGRSISGDDGGLPRDGTSSPDSVLDGAGDMSPLQTISWVKVVPGSFNMGSPKNEPCRLQNEQQHKVTLTRPFQISRTEITQRTFEMVEGRNPSHFSTCGPACPVDSISWSDAVVFCNRLSELAGLGKCYKCDGKNGVYAFPYDCTVRDLYHGNKKIHQCPGYRLPTEAEWEYAYRAGTSTAFYSGSISSCSSDSKAFSIAWCNANASSQSHAAGGKKANPWGLQDMAGNLWEWTNDWYTWDMGATHKVDPVGPMFGKARVLRGGSWLSSPGSLRAATRNQNIQSKTLNFVGFRCARTLSGL